MVHSSATLKVHSLEVPDTLRLQVTPEQFEQLAIVNREQRAIFFRGDVSVLTQSFNYPIAIL